MIHFHMTTALWSRSPSLFTNTEYHETVLSLSLFFVAIFLFSVFFCFFLHTHSSDLIRFDSFSLGLDDARVVHEACFFPLPVLFHY